VLLLQALVARDGLNPVRVMALAALAVRARAVTVAGHVRWPAGLTILLPSEHQGRLHPVLLLERERVARRIAAKAARGWPPASELHVDVVLEPTLVEPYAFEVSTGVPAIGSRAVAAPPTIRLPDGGQGIVPPTEPAEDDDVWVLRAADGKPLVVPPLGFVLGRGAAAAERLDSRTSRRHALVQPHPSGLRVSDLESRNGTQLDRRPVRSSGEIARAGQELRIGRTTFRIERLSLADAQTVRLGSEQAGAR